MRRVVHLHEMSASLLQSGQPLRKVRGFTSYYLDTAATVTDMGSCTSGGGTSCHTFGSQPHVVDVQNVQTPYTLTASQQASSVSFSFNEQSSFDVSWGVVFLPNWQSNTYDRRFWFSFTSDLTPSCPPPPCQTTSSPSPPQVAA